MKHHKIPKMCVAILVCIMCMNCMVTAVMASGHDGKQDDMIGSSYYNYKVVDDISAAGLSSEAAGTDDASQMIVEYDSAIKNCYGANNCSYTAYSALYADRDHYYRAATWIQTMGGNVPAGSMRANTRLYNASGALLKESGMVSNIEETYFLAAAIDSVYSGNGAFSKGKVELYNGDHYEALSLYKTEAIGGSGAELSYQINSNGKTYGSAALSEIVGYEPELIYAIGTEGQQGFVKREDIKAPDMDSPEEAVAYMQTRPETYMIPLYDLEEKVVGEFEISAEYVSFYTLKEAKEALNVKRGNTYSGPVEQTELINGNFPVNINGETYGNGLMAIEVGHSPDLLSAWGTNGQKGYIKQSDIRSCPEDATPQEVYEWYTSQPKSYEIPLYDFQGNIIGSFLVERGALTDKEIEAKIH